MPVPPETPAFVRRTLNMRRRCPYLRFNDRLWNEMVRAMAAAGITTVVLDLGDGVRYESHPEIAVRGAWTPARLKRELLKLRALGLEPVPKLNFSATHDEWLGPYSRCVSSDTYHGICRDVISEAIHLFEGPRLFHLGMDEETMTHQKFDSYIVVPQGAIW